MSDLVRREDVVEALYQAIRTTLIDTFADSMSLAIVMANNLPTAEPEWRWIPVTERLPKKENKSYWICTDTKHQCECRWTNNIYGIGKSNNWGWSIFDILQYTKVIAWMLLPEPWKEE